MREKLSTIGDAIAMIQDGDTVAIGGHAFGGHPMALVHEVIRQGRRGLHLQGWRNGIDMDMLIGAGCAASVETSYVGMFGRGLAPNYQRAFEQSGLQVFEHSESTSMDMFRAATMGAGFFPTKSPLGSDLMHKNPHLTEIQCPFSGQPYAAVQAAHADVAVLHAHTADRYGNVQLDAQRCPSADVFIAKSAKRTIVSVEQIVSDEELYRNSSLTVIPRQFVSAVVEAPYGAHPCACDSRYDYDLVEVKRYCEASQSEGAFEQYLNSVIRGSKDHMAYLDAIGIDRLMALTRTRLTRE